MSTDQPEGFDSTAFSLCMRNSMDCVTKALESHCDGSMVQFYLSYARDEARKAYRDSYTRAEQIAGQRMLDFVAAVGEAIRRGGLAVWDTDNLAFLEKN